MSTENLATEVDLLFKKLEIADWVLTQTKDLDDDDRRLWEDRFNSIYDQLRKEGVSHYSIHQTIGIHRE